MGRRPRLRPMVLAELRRLTEEKRPRAAPLGMLPRVSLSALAAALPGENRESIRQALAWHYERANCVLGKPAGSAVYAFVPNTEEWARTFDTDDERELRPQPAKTR